MIAWIANILGISKWIAGAGLAILILIAGALIWLGITSRIDNRIDDAHQAGKIEERASTAGEVIHEVQKANNADQHRDADRDKRLCGKDSRTPANCQ